MENIEKGQELLEELITKAWNNATFKEQLISNPEQTIENITGKKLIFPKNSKVIVEDQTDINNIYINIPRKIELDDLELSDEQLENVSGGDVATALAVIAVCSILYSAGTGVYDAVTDGKE